jgi:HEAT repeat protein
MITNLSLQDRLLNADPSVRRLAVMELPYGDEDDFIALAMTCLKDVAAEVRMEAVRALEGQEDLAVVEALAPMLLDADPQVRGAASEVLAELKEPSSAPPLLPLVDPQHSSEARANAFRALRALRYPLAFAPAIQALRDVEPAVRREAVGVLGYLKDESALGELAEVAANDPEAEVRRSAVGALGFASSISVQPALVRALTDRHWQVREEAAQTIGKLRLGLAIPDLVQAMQDEYWQVRVKATRSLGILKAEAGLPALVDSLKHQISNLRKEAAIALGEIGDTRAISPLEAALADPDPDVRKVARLALTSIGLAQKSKA